VREVKQRVGVGNAKINIMKGVKHYTESGEYSGPTHKMDGKVHTGAKHSEDSKVVSHSPDGPFKMNGFPEHATAAPLKRCYKTGGPGNRGYMPNPDGRPAKESGSCVPRK